MSTSVSVVLFFRWVLPSTWMEQPCTKACVLFGSRSCMVSVLDLGGLLPLCKCCVTYIRCIYSSFLRMLWSFSRTGAKTWQNKTKILRQQVRCNSDDDEDDGLTMMMTTVTAMATTTASKTKMSIMTRKMMTMKENNFQRAIYTLNT